MICRFTNLAKAYILTRHSIDTFILTLGIKRAYCRSDIEMSKGKMINPDMSDEYSSQRVTLGTFRSENEHEINSRTTFQTDLGLMLSINTLHTNPVPIVAFQRVSNREE